MRFALYFSKIRSEEENMEKMSEEKRTLIFAVAGYNLAETGRMIEIARAAKEQFNVMFMSYGGKFEDLIEE